MRWPCFPAPTGYRSTDRLCGGGSVQDALGALVDAGLPGLADRGKRARWPTARVSTHGEPSPCYDLPQDFGRHRLERFGKNLRPSWHQLGGNWLDTLPFDLFGLADQSDW